MQVIVCVKQVPDPEAANAIRIDPVTNTLIREGVPSIVNPFDTFAVEEAVRIKEKFGGKTIAISMGPPQAIEALRETIAVGVDEAILISDPCFAGADTLATSYTLSKAIEKIKDYDLIICGKQAIDGDTAQVGPGIAEHLGIPFVTFVRKIEEINPEEKLIRVQRLTEEGYEVIEMRLPALITVVKEINIPRLPSLRGKLKAKNAVIPVWTAKDLNVDINRVGLAGSPTQVIKVFTPELKTAGEILTGSLSEQVDTLIKKLRAAQII